MGIPFKIAEGAGSARPPTHAGALRGSSGRWREGGTTESDEGAATEEDATTAANTAKGVAEGSDWRARNEPPESTIEA